MKQLTQRQRHGLIFAIGQGIHPDPERSPVKPRVVRALAGAGHIALGANSRGRPLWKATETGRALIASEGLEPVYLHRRGYPSYTTDPSVAMAREREPLPRPVP